MRRWSLADAPRDQIFSTWMLDGRSGLAWGAAYFRNRAERVLGGTQSKPGASNRWTQSMLALQCGALWNRDHLFSTSPLSNFDQTASILRGILGSSGVL